MHQRRRGRTRSEVFDDDRHTLGGVRRRPRGGVSARHAGDGVCRPLQRGARHERRMLRRERQHCERRHHRIEQRRNVFGRVARLLATENDRAEALAKAAAAPERIDRGDDQRDGHGIETGRRADDWQIAAGPRHVGTERRGSVDEEAAAIDFVGIGNRARRDR